MPRSTWSLHLQYIKSDTQFLQYLAQILSQVPKNGAEGAVLENFNAFSEKLFLKNAIKSEN